MRCKGQLSWTALILLLVTACAPPSPSQNQSGRYSHSVITAEEMEAATQSDLYAVVQALRPQWLRNRGVSSINMRESIKVYVDNTLLGGPESLRQIPAHAAASIRFLDGVEASQRWGLDHGMGAIVVVTRRN